MSASAATTRARRLVEDEGLLRPPPAARAIAAAPRSGTGRKPTKRKRSVGRPETDRAAIAALGPGTGRTGMPVGSGLAHEAEARIGDARRSRVRDQRDVVAGAQLREDPLALPALVVLEVGGRPRRDAVGSEQNARSAACPRRRRGATSRRTRSARRVMSSRFPSGVATT